MENQKIITPEIINTDRLPLQLKGNQWILRKRLGNGKRLEKGLGTKNRAEAERRARKIIHDKLQLEHLTEWDSKIADGLGPGGWCRLLLNRLYQRTKKKGGSMTMPALEFILKRSGGYCEVSGIPLYLGDEKRHPFQPSIDRIDSSVGYEPWNIRVVCLAVNYCMSHWGEKVFNQISAAMMKRYMENILKNGG